MSYQNRTFVQQSQVSGSLGNIAEVPASLSTYQSDQRTLADDLGAIRFQVNQIIGSGSWLDGVAQDLNDIYGAFRASGANATFQGDVTVTSNLSAVNATLSGDMSAVNGTLSGDLSAVSGSFSGDISASSGTLSGGLSVAGAADFNGDVTANKISIDGDVAQRLYIVDADGSIKDEANLSFTGTMLQVTGSVDISANMTALSGSFANGLYVGGDGVYVAAGGMQIAGDSLEVDGTLLVKGVSTLDSLYVTGSSTNMSGTLTVAGAADFNGDVTANKISIDGDVAQRLYIVDADGSIKDEASLTFDGSTLAISGDLTAHSGTFNGDLDVNGTLTVASFALDGDVAQRLYIVGDDGAFKDESKLTFDGSTLTVTGNVAASSASLGGTLEVTGAADFNGDVTANKISIDGDVAQRLYIVDADGSIKDEAGLTYANSVLTVDGNISADNATFSNNVTVTGAISIDGDVAQRLYIVGAGGEIKDESKLTFDGSTLAVTGNASASGTLTVSGVADFNGDVTANKISIDGDVGNRLYIVDTDGSIKDEAKLTFNGSALEITGNVTAVSGAFSSNVSMNNLSAAEGSFSGNVSMVDLSASNATLSGDMSAVNATLSGDMSAVNGTLSGDLSAVSGTFSSNVSMNNLSAAEGTFTGNVTMADLTANNGTFDGDISATNGTFTANISAVSGSFSGDVDVAGALTVGSFALDGDVAQRLYIVDADGSLKDESKLVFDGSKLTITGDLAAVSGTFNGDLDVNGSISAVNISIDGDVAQRLYIVDADGSIKDESKLTFDGSVLAVTGDVTAASGTFSGAMDVTGNAIFRSDVQVVGNLEVKGATTWIETENLVVKDAFIHLATGSTGTSDSGIVLHKGDGSQDLIVGQNGGVGEFIFATANVDAAVDSDNAIDLQGASLVPAWMSSVKIGDMQGSLSGSLAIDGNYLSLTASSELVFGDKNDSLTLGGTDDWTAFRSSPIGSATSIVGALASLASGGSSKKAVVSGSAIAVDTNIEIAVDGQTFRSSADMAKDLDVYLNGILLRGNNTDVDCDYYKGNANSGSGAGIKLNFALTAADVLTVVFRNPEAV